MTGSGNGGSIDCPDQCAALILQNTSITLTASPDNGATFGGWGGDCASSGPATACTLTLTGQGSNGSKSVTAGFGVPPPPPKQFTLKVAKMGTAPGYVGGGGIDCGRVCAQPLVEGTKVALVAVPTGRAVFLGWGAPCSDTAACGVTMRADTTVTATFVDPRRPYVVTLAGAVARGKATLLRFHFWARRSPSREELTVVRGKALLAHAKVAMRRVSYRRTYSLRWLVPRAVAPGAARFCAVAVDQSGRRSPRSCSPLEIA